ncbi:MAG TPA: 3'-5' exonuclease, partial [Acetobacteraceae bacterium]|nr:3'-5' exonuclease [Acetobacteraceae bacterium]
AADPVDEFLNAALAFERSHPPSLQGFLHWVRQGSSEVKREQEEAGDAVRIMTVHGAKGLQAPVVILPDTVASGRDKREVRWDKGPDGLPLPLWAPNQDHQPPLYREALERERQARREEENRLLYVALTRAEDRLVVAGWQRRPSKEATWYDLVAQGFSRLEGCREERFEPARFGAPAACRFAGEVARRLDCPQEAPPRPDGGDALAPDAAELPAWTRIPAAPEIAAQPLSPSALPGEQGPAAAPHGPADPGGRRFRRGRVVHALLQHLPDRAPHEREAAARRFLARPGHGLTPAEQVETLAEVLALLDSPEVAAAFGPGSLAEAPLAGTLGGRLVSGQVDRLVVTSARVLVLDYKTNRPPPASPEAVAPVYLRQMAAYRALLRQVWPGRQVDCALVWTYGARLMMLPQDLLDRHAPAA